MNKTSIIIIIAIILAVAIFFIWYSSAAKTPVNPVSMPSGMILFYGEGCPHCKNVDDFVSQNKIEDKVKFTRLEVWYDKDNQIRLAQAAQKCNITSSEVGVPFLYDGNDKCYVGDTDIINFLKNEAGIQ